MGRVPKMRRKNPKALLFKILLSEVSTLKFKYCIVNVSIRYYMVPNKCTVFMFFHLPKIIFSIKRITKLFSGAVLRKQRTNKSEKRIAGGMARAVCRQCIYSV